MTNALVKKLDHAANKLHTHTVVFKRHSQEERVAVMAQAGMTTKGIAQQTGMTESQVQYRILKAQRVLKVQFRKEYRNGNGLAQVALRAIYTAGCERIQTYVAPKFIPLALSRLNQ